MKFPNWKTTVAGFVLGVLSSMEAGYSQGAFTLNSKSVIAFLVPTILGALAKSFDVTGIGTKATTDPSKDATVPTPLPPDVAAPK